MHTVTAVVDMGLFGQDIVDVAAVKVFDLPLELPQDAPLLAIPEPAVGEEKEVSLGCCLGSGSLWAQVFLEESGGVTAGRPFHLLLNILNRSSMHWKHVQVRGLWAWRSTASGWVLPWSRVVQQAVNLIKCLLEAAAAEHAASQSQH